MTMLMILCLITLTSQQVDGKEIIINTDGTSDNNTCCVDGECACTSLSAALHYITSNTVITITSRSVTLEGQVKMGSSHLNNITITGNGATIMCTNGGSVYCEYCSNVVIEGITWDGCGNPNETYPAGVTFYIILNISLCNCTFQHSPVQAVSLLRIFQNVLVNKCRFMQNALENAMEEKYSESVLFAPSIVQKSIGSYNLTIIIHECSIFNNGYEIKHGPGAHILPLSLYIRLLDNYSIAKYHICISNTNIFSNKGKILIEIGMISWISIQFITVKVFNQTTNPSHSYFHTTVMGIAIVNDGYGKPEVQTHKTHYSIMILSSEFYDISGSNVYCHFGAHDFKIMISDSNFSNSTLYGTSMVLLDVITYAKMAQIKFSNVSIINNTNLEVDDGKMISIIHEGSVEISMILVRLKSNIITSKNNYTPYNGMVRLVSKDEYPFAFYLKGCECTYNKYSGQGAIFHYTAASHNYNHISMYIINTLFHHNSADNGIIYLAGDTDRLMLTNSKFINNYGSVMHLLHCHLMLFGTITFENNTAEIGGAVYLGQYSSVLVNNATVYFVNNSASQYGGVMYLEYMPSRSEPSCFNDHHFQVINSSMNFVNNYAGIAGNSLYFNFPPKYCQVVTNIHDNRSIMYTPCQWSYSQVVDGNLTNITCDYNHTLLKGTPFPIVTVPRELRLYFVNNDGLHILSNSYDHIYFKKNNILGRRVTFRGAVFDFFGKPAEPTLFGVECNECYSFVLDSSYLLLTISSFQV